MTPTDPKVLEFREKHKHSRILDPKHFNVESSNIMTDGTLIEKTEEGPIIVHNETTTKPPKKVLTYKEILLHHLTSKQIKTLEKWMRPNNMSQEGFLNEKERLRTVIKNDEKTLDHYGISHKKIAKHLKAILKKRAQMKYEDRNSDGSWSVISNNIPFKVQITAYCGYQDCPYEELKEYQDVKQGQSSYDILLTNQNDHRSIFFSYLHPHLIEYHHFFEGHTKYRLDPVQAMKTLELI